jgi:hypothetical protein
LKSLAYVGLATYHPSLSEFLPVELLSQETPTEGSDQG